MRRCPLLALLLVLLASGYAHGREELFGKALRVQSTAGDSRHRGEIRAVVDQPFGMVAQALAEPRHWCSILTLQVNIKRCEPAADRLAAFITRRPRDSVSDAHRLDFGFAAGRKGSELNVVLIAPSGPVGTSDYEITVEAKPLDENRTAVHLTYAYTLGFMARLAMDAYLAGPGREKFGFTVVERRADGSPVHVDGVRGVIERAAMRYYLALDASLPPGQPLETRLRRWYNAIDSHPQLREQVKLEEYVDMKRREAASSAS